MHGSRNIGILDHLIHTYLGQGPAGGPPTGVELSTTLKWFSTTLLNVLKDVPGQPFVMMRSKVRRSRTVGGLVNRHIISYLSCQRWCTYAFELIVVVIVGTGNLTPEEQSECVHDSRFRNRNSKS